MSINTFYRKCNYLNFISTDKSGFYNGRIMKTALITGASGGIGKSTVKKFLTEGYFVIALYNSGKKRTEDFISALKPEEREMLYPVKCDLRCAEEVSSVISTLDQNFKHIDVLVNNAGIDIYKLLTETSEKEWDDIFTVNVKSAFSFSKYALKSMIERKSGAIVNVSSVWGVVGACMETAYSASKSALIGLTKSLSKEVAPSGITVNCVCPGVIDTPMNARLTSDERTAVINEIPVGREGSSEEVAELIYFLSSEQARYITGEAINIGGGFAL